MNNSKTKQSVSAEHRAKISATKKAMWKDPQFRARAIERLNEGRRKSKHHAEVIRNSIKLRWADPEKRAKLLESIAAGKQKEKTSMYMQKVWKNPELREKRLASITAVIASPEYKQRITDIMRKTGKAIVGLPKFLPDHPKALHIKLRDPNNRVWEVHNVTKFVEDHLDLFEPRHLEFKAGGHRKAVAALFRLTAKKQPRKTALGWALVSATEVFYNNGEDLLERQQYEVHSI